jgi:hypothetical protein
MTLSQIKMIKNFRDHFIGLTNNEELQNIEINLISDKYKRSTENCFKNILECGDGRIKQIFLSDILNDINKYIIRINQNKVDTDEVIEFIALYDELFSV